MSAVTSRIQPSAVLKATTRRVHHQIHGAVPAVGKRQHCGAVRYGTHARLRAGAGADLRGAAPLVSSATLRRNASMRLTTRCGGTRVFLRSGMAPACLAFRCAPDMLTLAEHILDSKASEFDPATFRDRYEEALLAHLKAKQAGAVPERRKTFAPPQRVVNLMEALRCMRPARVPSASRCGRSTRPPAIACASSSSMKKPASRSPPSTKAAATRWPRASTLSLIHI